MWQFARHELDTQEAVSLWRLGDRLVITDGHTRALAAWLMGRDRIIARWESDPLDWEAYRICVHWCEESGISSVPDLTGRVLNTEKFRSLWLDRCLTMQSHLHQERTKRRAVPESPFTYRQPVSAQPVSNPEPVKASPHAQPSPSPQPLPTATTLEADDMTRPLSEMPPSESPLPEPPAALVNRPPSPAASQATPHRHTPSNPAPTAQPTHLLVTQEMLDEEMTLPLVGLPPEVTHAVDATSLTSGQPVAAADTPSADSQAHAGHGNRSVMSYLDAAHQTPPRSSLGRKRFEDGDMTLPLRDPSFEGNGVQPTSKPSKGKPTRKRRSGRERSRDASAQQAIPPSVSQHPATAPSPAQKQTSRPTTAINWSYEDQTIIDTPHTQIDPPQTQINPSDGDAPPTTDAPSTSTPAQSQS
jgi:hypothetical protein